VISGKFAVGNGGLPLDGNCTSRLAILKSSTINMQGSFFKINLFLILRKRDFCSKFGDYFYAGVEAHSCTAVNPHPRSLKNNFSLHEDPHYDISLIRTCMKSILSVRLAVRKRTRSS
jgi:hypothetical protein